MPAKVFLSFAQRDVGIALEFKMLLEDAGVSTFCAREDIHAGDEWSDSLRNALAACSEVVCLVAPESVGSDWVLMELGAAWVLRKRITPILLHGAMDQVPDAIRRFQCVSVESAGGWRALIKQIASRHGR